MKKCKLFKIAAVVAAIITGLSVPTTAYATSRTTAVEIVAASRSFELNAQVLGATRTSSAEIKVDAKIITDNSVISTLSSIEAVSNIINEVLGKGISISLSESTSNANTTNVSKEVKAEELTVVDTMDISVPAGTVVSEEQPVYLTFAVPSLTDNSEVYVLHYHSSVWEVVPSEVVNGQVVAKFTSFSPVAIVVKSNTLNGAVKGATRKKSPRTGDDRFWIILCLGAVCVAGAASSKKLFP